MDDLEKKRWMIEILKKVLIRHKEDIAFSIKHNYSLDGLCEIVSGYNNTEEVMFLKYLSKSVDRDLESYVWDRNNKDTSRLDWLVDNIAKLKKEVSYE